MIRDPLAWDGDRPPWARREKRRIYRRCILVGLWIAAGLVYGIYGE